MSSSNNPKPPTKRFVNKNRTCRNVIIHGFCKYEGKGCEFKHDQSTNRPVDPTAIPVVASGSKTTGTPLNVPEFVPDANNNLFTDDQDQVKIIQHSPKFNIDSPEFLPGGKSSIVTRQQSELESQKENQSQLKWKPTAAPFTPSEQNSKFVVQEKSIAVASFTEFHPSQDSYAKNSLAQESNMDHPLAHEEFKDILNQFESIDIHQSQEFYPEPQVPLINHQPRQTLQYHLYTNPSPQGLRLNPNERTIHSFFISDTLREDLLKRSEAILHCSDIVDTEFKKKVSELDVYHSLHPLDLNSKSKVFGYKTSVFKGISSVDGGAYVLYRIHGFRITGQEHLRVLEKWKSFHHSSVVSFKEAFTTNSFGDNSLIMVYDYLPNSNSLFNNHVSSYPAPNQPVQEDILWTYITQITSALQNLHQKHLSSRLIEPSKILITGKNRIRLNCVGCMDVLAFDQQNNDINQFKQQDLLHFGQLLVSLGTGALGSLQNIPRALEFISSHYSTDLTHILQYLLSPPSEFKSIDDVVVMIGPRLLTELSAVHSYADQLENEMTKELENGRLIRLMCKLGFINERPEFEMDPSWSETGDRYLLKLFRDYVFHQVDAEGKPIVDLVHVLSCLNKLDTGYDEKIMMMSRDEQSCLIVSYKDLKQCIDTTFRELTNRATRLS